MRSPAKPATPSEFGVEPHPAEGSTCDAFLGGKLKIHQPAAGPRAGIDAVFLAASVPALAGANQTALEAGTGCGVVALALASRVEGLHVTGIELQSNLCHLAKRNAELNGLGSRLHFVEADMSAPRERLEGLGLRLESFDHVIANPPFHTEGLARKPQQAAKTRAHMAKAGALQRWIRFLTAMAAPHATVTLIHRADALLGVLAELEGRFGAITVFPLFPHADEPANRIIVQGVKGSRAPLKLCAGMILHDAEGCYTEAAEKVLRGGERLTMRPEDH